MYVFFTLPPEWDYSFGGLVAIVKEGKCAVRSAINELKEAGYIDVELNRGPKGLFKYKYRVHRKPSLERNLEANSPTPENRSTDNRTSENQQEVLFNTDAFLTDESVDLPKDLREAYYALLADRFRAYDAESQLGFVCRSQAEEFAGCITASVMTGKQEKTMVLTSFFVPETFRGLGIGTELINMLFQKLRACGKKMILLPNIFIPEFFEPFLIRRGFKKIRNGFFAVV